MKALKRIKKIVLSLLVIQLITSLVSYAALCHGSMVYQEDGYWVQIEAYWSTNGGDCCSSSSGSAIVEGVEYARDSAGNWGENFFSYYVPVSAIQESAGC